MPAESSMTRATMMGLCCALSLSGCVSTALEGPVQQEKLYRTGSNIPRREGSMPDGVETSTVSTGDTRFGVPGVPKPMGGSH
jgi:hypothetical protein